MKMKRHIMCNMFSDWVIEEEQQADVSQSRRTCHDDVEWTSRDEFRTLLCVTCFQIESLKKNSKQMSAKVAGRVTTTSSERPATNSERYYV